VGTLKKLGGKDTEKYNARSEGIHSKFGALASLT
jgi:hypothetical protein